MITSGRRRRKRVVAAGTLLVLLVAGALAWRAFHVSMLAQIGVGYAAERTCACLFISHRQMASCMTDLDPLAQKLVRITPGDDEVSARSYFTGAHATARFEKGFGCSLEN